jgi:ABC-2 type transport system ATP-binding protein
VLLTTQYLDEADQLADRIAVIDHGKVVAEGTTGELKASIGTATLQLKLTTASSVGEASNIVQKALGVQPANPEPTVLAAPMADPERVTDLLVDLRKAGIHLSEVSVQKPTLDEVFLTLTGKPTKQQKQEED